MNFKFELNDMQVRSKELAGQNIILNAPTGSGKTEAFLLNLAKSKRATLLLPTVTSCIFMYKRLCNDFHTMNVNIQTSLLTETRHVENAECHIRIMCPDGPLIEYLKNKKANIRINPFFGETLILDELDSYPEMCISVLLDYLQEFNKTHVIIASATMNKDLIKTIERFKFQTITYNQDIKIIKHKIKTIKSFNEIKEICKTNPTKKIGIIANSIKGMERIKPFIETLRKPYIYHHAQITDYERLENEEKLFNKNFNIVLSNDLIAWSVDIDLDILIMDVSDKLDTNIQRLGRNNRTNKSVDYINTYIIDPNISTPVRFIDETEQYHQQETYFSNWLTYSKLQELRTQIAVKQIPTINHVLEYWDKLAFEKRHENLREIPICFETDATITRTTFYKQINQLVEEKIKTKKIFKINGDIKYANAPYSSLNTKKKNIVYFGENYRILTGKQDKNGRIKIKKHENECYLDCPSCEKRVSEQEFHWGEHICHECLGWTDSCEYED